MALARIDVGIEDSRGRVLARAAQHEGAVWWAVQLRGARVATGIVPDPPGKTRDVPAWLRGRVHELWGRAPAEVTLADGDVGLDDWTPGAVEVADDAAPALRVQQVVDNAGELVAEVRPVDGDAVVVAPDGTEVARHVGGARSAATLREVVRRLAPPPPAARVQIRRVRG